MGQTLDNKGDGDMATWLNDYKAYKEALSHEFEGGAVAIGKQVYSKVCQKSVHNPNSLQRHFCGANFPIQMIAVLLISVVRLFFMLILKEVIPVHI